MIIIDAYEIKPCKCQFSQRLAFHMHTQTLSLYTNPWPVQFGLMNFESPVYLILYVNFSESCPYECWQMSNSNCSQKVHK